MEREKPSRFASSDREGVPMKVGLAPAQVELHIEELVLHGFPPGDRYAIADAVERELTRLLGGVGAVELARKSMQVVQLDAGSFKVAPGSRSATVGAQVAQALYGNLASLPCDVQRTREPVSKGSKPR